MFIPDTADDFASAYLEARRAKVPVDQMGTVERAGYFLLSSAGRSVNGEMCPRDALGRALWAGEIDAAMLLHEGLMASHEVEISPRCNPDSMAASGSFEAR
jgi:hypothetical protein